MSLFTVELQRPYGVVATRKVYGSRVEARLALREAIKQAGPTGFVIVLCNGKEITYDQLRGGAYQKHPGGSTGKRLVKERATQAHNQKETQ